MLEIITSVLIFILGTAIGSFLNVLIDRLANEERINGHSHCDYCQKKIAWYDLIPILSFFVLKGKSRCCHKKLSFQYPLIEALTGTVFILIYNGLRITDYLTLFSLLGIVSCLIIIFVSDLKYHLISDYIQMAFFIFSIIYHLRSISQFPGFLISGFLIALPIWLIYFFSREKAMGLGDAFLAANIGFLLGLQNGFLALYIAFVTGAIFGLFLILLKRKKFNSRVPFGPFIVVGTVTMLFYGDKIMDLIRKIYGF